MSDLEKEFELEMEDVAEAQREATDDSEQEFELEMEDVAEAQREADSSVDDIAQKFLELSQREFETESEVDSALNGLLNEIEREYFFKKWGKKLFRKAVKFGGKYVKRLPAFKAIKAVSQLARGDLKGTLMALAKSGLASAIPGGSAVLPALKALGVFETKEDSESDLDSWRNYVGIAKEAYEQLADSLNEASMKDPVSANRQAMQAYQSAIAKHRRLPASGAGSRRRKVYKFRVKSGDDFIIRIKGY